MATKANARISVRNRCKARFQAEGRTYDNIQLLKLGTDGCSIEVPVGTQARISGDTVLEGWSLIHPLLPAEAIQAKVLWVHHDDTTRAGFMEAEVKFTGASESFWKDLRSGMTILSDSRPQCVGHDLVGMP